MFDVKLLSILFVAKWILGYSRFGENIYDIRRILHLKGKINLTFHKWTTQGRLT